jgi:hypothetical protein
MWLRALAGPAFVLFVASPASSQTDAPAPQLSLLLRPPVAYVGEELRAPLYIEGTGAETLQKLALRIRFPTRLLSFVTVDRGFLLERHPVKIDTKTTTDDKGITTLAVDVLAEHGLTDGLILYLRFKVAAAAPLGGDIPVTVQAEAASPGAAAPRRELAFTTEPVRISPRKKDQEFMVACFFYMH